MIENKQIIGHHYTFKVIVSRKIGRFDSTLAPMFPNSNVFRI